MAFAGDRKRKKIRVDLASPLGVLDLPIEKMILEDDSHKAYFSRLGYKSCPNLRTRSNGRIFKLKKGQVLEDMNRWQKVQDLYSIMVKLDKSPRTKINIYNGMVCLIQYCDRHEIDDFYSAFAIRSFISDLKRRYHQGQKSKTLIVIQGSIKTILLEKNPSLMDELKNDFLSLPKDAAPTLPYSDDEIKKMVIALYKIFNILRVHVLAGTTPKIHPLYDEEVLENNNNFNAFTEGAWRKKVYSENNHNTWLNEIIKSAYFLTSFYTGANESALVNLKLSDITSDTFTEEASGNFILKTVKGRQAGKVNYLEIGFSKQARNFFETWLLLRKIIIKSEFDYVFPSIVKDKITRSKPSSVSVTINGTFKLLGLPILSTKRFRKTKATLIMRATESIFSVAEGLNNSPETVSKHYADGVPETMEFSLAGALDVRHRTAQGEPFKNAVIDSAYNFSDPIREQFYKKNQLNIPNVLSNGLRCTDSFGEKAKLLKKSLVRAEIVNIEDKVACHKFLECFGCPHHAVIAEVEDIWLMLSFRDVILEASCQPSINSIPTNTITKIIHTLESILERLKNDFSTEYKQAEARYLNSPHPLWLEQSDLGLLSEAY